MVREAIFFLGIILIEFGAFPPIPYDFTVPPKRLPPTATLLPLATLLTSAGVALVVTGRPWSTVNITSFHEYGGITTAHLQNGEWWRVITSQLVHVKQGHMLLNVVLLYMLSIPIERSVGFLRLFTVWLIGGGIGTYASSLFIVAAPWNVGTGASQAIMSLAAFCWIMIRRGYPSTRGISWTIVISIGINIGLDLVFAGYPKPGKIIAFLTGILLGFVLIPRMKPVNSTTQQ